MDIQIILNPQADQGRAGRLATQLEQLSGEQATVLLTKQAGHAQALAVAAAAQGVDLVIAAGGDGTVHEVVNGLMTGAEGPASTRPALGILPLGTGNDLAYALGIAANRPAQVLPQLLRGEKRPLDIGHITTDNAGACYFANGIGIGMDALVAIEASQIGFLTDFPLYLAAAARVIARRIWRWQVAVEWDGEQISQEMVMFAIGNGQRAGGGFLLTPQAVVDDGFLTTCLVTPMSRPWIVYMLLKTMRGTHVGSPLVKMGQQKEIHIKADTPLPIHLDGEIIATLADNVREVTVRCLPNALQVVL